MNEKMLNGSLGVKSYEDDELHVMLVTLGATVPFLPYVFATAVLALVSFSIILFKRTRTALMQHRRMYTIAIAIIVISLLGAVLSLNYLGMIICLGIFWVLTLGTYLRTVMTKKLYARVQNVAVLGGIISAVICAVEKIINRASVNFRPTAFAFNANYLGFISAIAALMSLIAFFEEKKNGDIRKYRLVRLFYSCGVIFNVATVFMSESRSSLLGLLAGVTLYFLLKKHYVLFALVVISGAAMWGIGYMYPQVFGWTNSLTFVFAQRVGIWFSGLDLFISSPLRILVGMGPMSYYFATQNGLLSDKWFDANWLHEIGLLKTLDDPSYTNQCITDITTAIHTHNIVVDTLVSAGVLGALCYLALVRSLLRHGNKRRKAGDKTAFASVLVACFTVLVAGTVDVTIMWHQSAVIFLLMCSAVYTDEYVK